MPALYSSLFLDFIIETTGSGLPKPWTAGPFPPRGLLGFVVLSQRHVRIPAVPPLVLDNGRLFQETEGVRLFISSLHQINKTLAIL